LAHIYTLKNKGGFRSSERTILGFLVWRTFW